MTQPNRTIRVVVELAFAEASVLARAAVVVTSALDCREANAADSGLRAFRSAVGLALSRPLSQAVVDRIEVAGQQSRRAS
ncbi:hypothetical protein [Lentzea sp. HUAS12]|uniref:hypothetical protein n=1 Tax=Lentzea sp. HUAS12 TaxID=2951806 RepID=UPI00209CCE35|nr:hypothetical protein [Lentzea sp. HUAS12]USX56450.1 hypothetical protein ND450_20815 [Lentzea sp. HUAS12]